MHFPPLPTRGVFWRPKETCFSLQRNTHTSTQDAHIFVHMHTPSTNHSGCTPCISIYLAQLHKFTGSWDQQSLIQNIPHILYTATQAVYGRTPQGSPRPRHPLERVSGLNRCGKKFRLLSNPASIYFNSSRHEFIDTFEFHRQCMNNVFAIRSSPTETIIFSTYATNKPISIS